MVFLSRGVLPVEKVCLSFHRSESFSSDMYISTEHTVGFLFVLEIHCISTRIPSLQVLYSRLCLILNIPNAVTTVYSNGRLWA
jgi:hypothetical protein